MSSRVLYGRLPRLPWGPCRAGIRFCSLSHGLGVLIIGCRNMGTWLEVGASGMHSCSFLEKWEKWERVRKTSLAREWNNQEGNLGSRF